jgi:hypothetical protein
VAVIVATPRPRAVTIPSKTFATDGADELQTTDEDPTVRPASSIAVN